MIHVASLWGTGRSPSMLTVISSTSNALKGVSSSLLSYQTASCAIGTMGSVSNSGEQDNATELLQQLQKALDPDEGPSNGKESKAMRKKACALAEKLVVELMEPGDFIDRVIMQVSYDYPKGIAYSPDS